MLASPLTTLLREQIESLLQSVVRSKLDFPCDCTELICVVIQC